MKEYQQKYIVRTLLYSRVTMVVLFLLIILLLRSIVELNNKRIEVSRLRQDSAAERADMQDKVAKATAKEEAIKTPRGFENYVRTTQAVVQNGEGVIVLYDEGQSPVTPVREDTNIWEKLLLLWNRVVKR